MNRVRVVACQQQVDQLLPENTLQQIKGARADFLCLPEHYPLPAQVKTLQEAAELHEERKNYLENVSRSLGLVLVGGTLTEKAGNGFYNTCYLFDCGEEIGFYRKVNPTEGEMSRGVLRGDEFKIFDVRGLRIGVLICADVLIEESFRELSSLRCQIVFAPTASPYREGESVADKFSRDRTIFLEGARKLQCPIVKTCAVGKVFGHQLQGRSLIATPDEILARAEPHQESESLLLIAEL